MKIPAPKAHWPASWKLSNQYDQRESGSDLSRPGYRYAYQLRIGRIQAVVQQAATPPATIIDVGAGQGTLSLRLAEAGDIVTWNDFRAELADYVRLKYECGNITYEPGDIFSNDRGLKFDAVVAAEIIEHVAHPDEFLRRLARLVEAGKPIIVSTPNGSNLFNKLPSFFEIPDPTVLESMQFQPDSDGHLFLLLASELQILANRAGLKVRSMDYIQTHVAYAVAKVYPRALQSKSFVRWLHRLDAFLVQIPWLGPKLAVQIVAVLQRD
jgi:2-polyprenyl-6-hydroxyphenyl methylase/3-demethylubiquinone-9 3-methyltransferase